MADTQNPSGERKRSGRRWWLQYRLRSLLGLMLLACLTMGWWRWHMHGYLQQQRALAAVAPVARHVGTRPGKPAWLRPLSDPEVYKDVWHLSFQSSERFNDSHLQQLAKFPHLSRLSLDRTSITNAGLFHLERLTDLDTLSLKNTRVTSAGLVHLRGLTNLKKLQLGNTRIDGEGLAHLAGLKKLEVLELDGPGFTDEHLAHLRRLTALKSLTLFNCHVRGPGLAHLKALPKLSELKFASHSLEQIELPGFPALRQAEFWGGNPGQASYRIQDCPALSQLTIQGVITRVELADLPSLSKLQLNGLSPWEMETRRQAKLVPLEPPQPELIGSNLPQLSTVTIYYVAGLDVDLRRTPPPADLRFLNCELRNLRLADGSDLEELHLCNVICNPSSTAPFANLPGVRRMKLLNVTKVDALFANSRLLERLEKLTLSAHDVEAIGLLPLQDAHRLTQVSFSADAIVGPGGGYFPLPRRNLPTIRSSLLAPLAALPALESLEFANCSFEPDALCPLSGVKSLAELRICNSWFPDNDPWGIENPVGIEQLQELTKVTLVATPVSIEELASLKQLPKLQLLEFDSESLLAGADELLDLSAALPPDCQLIMRNGTSPQFKSIGGRVVSGPAETVRPSAETR